MHFCHWCGEEIPQLPGARWRDEGGVIRQYHRRCFDEMVDEEAAAETPEEARAAYEEDYRED